MNIIWYGLNCFKMQSKETVLVTDPFDSSIGIKSFQGQADIVTTSRKDAGENIKMIKGNPFIIDSAGEYDIKEISIQGISDFGSDNDKKTKEENIIYTYEMEGIKICHLGNIRSILSNSELDKIGQIDILFVPVGGNFTINGEKADEIINIIEPKIVIPMNYKTKGVNLKIDGVDKFLKEMGVTTSEKIQKFSIKKKDLQDGETKIIVFEDPNA